MSSSPINQRIARAQRSAIKNDLLDRASAEALPRLADGNIPEAVRVLEAYAPKVGRLLTQEKLYSEDTPGGKDA